MVNQNDLPEVVRQDTTSLLNQTYSNIVAGLTGLASSEKKELVLALGHILQRMRAGTFIKSVAAEWEDLKEKGRIKEDYQFTDQHLNCLQELLDFLDKEITDETRFETIKKIFLVTSTEIASDRDSVLPQQYMRICRTLQSGEVIVLNTVYKIAKSELFPSGSLTSATTWLEIVAKESSLSIPELVEIHEEQLINKKLLSEREHSDKSGVSVRNHFRLTKLGLDLCEFISNYERLRS